MKYLVLVIVNLLLIWFSWKISLKAKRYHGIPRFVVFEGIVLLIFFNYPVWFQDAFSLRQMASWVLLIGSLSIAIWALVNYFTHGKPKDRFEETVHIVNTGIYSVIRHPMYFSLLLFAYGAFLKNPNILNHGLSLGVLLATFITCSIEEKEMQQRFGEKYLNYMKLTRIPWMIALWGVTLLTYRLGWFFV